MGAEVVMYLLLSTDIAQMLHGQCTLAVCDSPGAHSWRIDNARKLKVHMFRIHACGLPISRFMCIC